MSFRYIFVLPIFLMAISACKQEGQQKEMFTKKVNELKVPKSISSDSKSVELLRVWSAEKSQKFVLRHDVWEDPAAWGILLVDLAKHVAKAYEKSGQRDYKSALERVKAGFDAEWSSPTDLEEK